MKYALSRVMISRMAKKGSPGKSETMTATKPGKPSALLDTRFIYRGDRGANGLEQLAKLPDACRIGT
jgi:hypothetical protein